MIKGKETMILDRYNLGLNENTLLSVLTVVLSSNL